MLCGTWIRGLRGDGTGLPMSELAVLPPAALKSVDEMLAVAHAMEREAAARYATLADCMRRVDQSEIADLFAGLAAEERGHVDSVERLAERMLHRTPDPALVHSALPETFVREDEANAAALLSPYRTLSIAVRHEERAFSFWAYVAAQSDSAALRELAEMFARQELIHAAKLRHARRRHFTPSAPDFAPQRARPRIDCRRRRFAPRRRSSEPASRRSAPSQPSSSDPEAMPSRPHCSRNSPCSHPLLR